MHLVSPQAGPVALPYEGGTAFGESSCMTCILETAGEEGTD